MKAQWSQWLYSNQTFYIVSTIADLSGCLPRTLLGISAISAVINDSLIGMVVIKDYWMLIAHELLLYENYVGVKSREYNWRRDR